MRSSILPSATDSFHATTMSSTSPRRWTTASGSPSVCPICSAGMSLCGTRIARIPTTAAPWMSSNRRSPTNTARAGSVHADRVEGGAERVRMRLRPRDVGRVDRAVDELGEPVALEDPLVLDARPDRVRQHADLDAALAQCREQPDGVRVGERVRLPPSVVAPRASRRCASTPASPNTSAMVALRCSSRLRTHTSSLAASSRCAASGSPTTAMPLGERVDVVPRRHRAAPVEDHCVDAARVTARRYRSEQNRFAASPPAACPDVRVHAPGGDVEVVHVEADRTARGSARARSTAASAAVPSPRPRRSGTHPDALQLAGVRR